MTLQYIGIFPLLRSTSRVNDLKLCPLQFVHNISKRSRDGLLGLQLELQFSRLSKGLARRNSECGEKINASKHLQRDVYDVHEVAFRLPKTVYSVAASGLTKQRRRTDPIQGADMGANLHLSSFESE